MGKPYIDMKQRNWRHYMWDFVSNPDGSGSTKRAAGWITLVMTFSLALAGFDYTIIGIFATLTAGCFGLSSWDYKTEVNVTKAPPAPAEEDPLVNYPYPMTPVGGNYYPGGYSSPTNYYNPPSNPQPPATHSQTTMSH